ncbi:MAG: sulfite exporter TauE/SafE family protein [Mycobacterium sp.]|nr:sulfite exporter TauE/SafE family protein [Mycobacterium sp.]
MSTDQMIAMVAVVIVLAVVQSLFGVGLLLFGTPIFLLLGLPFEQVLGYLLPCSIVVSGLQVVTSGGLTLEPIRRQFLMITAPAVLVATGAAVALGTPHQIRLIVGVVLLVTAISRVGRLQPVLRRTVGKHSRPLMLVLGIVHGWSNLGGGILTVIVGASFEDKVSIRRQIAFAYGSMAIIQLSVVMATVRPHLALGLWLLLPVIAGIVFLLIGQRAFQKARQRPYQLGLTGLILSFGALLVATA